MAKPNAAKQGIGLTRGKAVLIGVLAVVFVAVVYIQYQKFSGTAVTTTTTRPRPAARTPMSAALAKIEDSRNESAVATQAAFLDFEQSKWTPPELPKVVGYDPFAVPDAFPQAPKLVGADAEANAGAITAADAAKQQADALEAMQTQLADLQQRGVHVIFSKDNQYVAMIGERTVHVGDEINGFIVTEIDPQRGVKVERNDAQ